MPGSARESDDRELGRQSLRHEAETLLDAVALQLGPIRIQPVNLALARAGRIDRRYWHDGPTDGPLTLDAEVRPR